MMSHVAWIFIGFPWTNKSVKSNTKVSVTQPDRSVDFKSQVPGDFIVGLYFEEAHHDFIIKAWYLLDL